MFLGKAGKRAKRSIDEAWEIKTGSYTGSNFNR